MVMTEKISPEEVAAQVTTAGTVDDSERPNLPEIGAPSLLIHPNEATREEDPDQAARIAETIRHREAMRRGGFRF